ncbi:hypothetical protein ACVIEO_005657 [Rhizobium leguminosarum]
MTLTMVDLPAPLCPTSPTHSPGMTRRVTPSSALTAPKLTLAPSTAITAFKTSSMLPAMPACKKCRAAICGRAAVAGRFTLPTR